MVERTPYVCRDCGQRVSTTSYRAACPDCDGELRPAPVGGTRSAATARAGTQPD